MVVGDRCSRQGRRHSEAVATAITAITVTMVSIWLGDLAVAAATVTLGDVAGRRGRTAVVALSGGG